MINGNPSEFIDRMYTCQDTVYRYNHVKYRFQGYVADGRVHMEIVQHEPPTEEYVWEYDGESFWMDKRHSKEQASSTGSLFGRRKPRLNGRMSDEGLHIG